MWKTLSTQQQTPVMLSVYTPIIIAFLMLYVVTPTQARTAQDCMIYRHSPASALTSMTTPSFEETVQMGFRLLPECDKTVWNATATITSIATGRFCEVEFNYNTSKNSYNIIVHTRCDGKEVKEEKWYTEDIVHGDQWTKLFFSVSSGGSMRELYISAQTHRGPEEFGAEANYLTGPFRFKWNTRSLMEFYLNCPHYCPIDNVELKMSEQKTSFYITRSEYFTKVKIYCDILGMGIKEMVLGKDLVPDDGLWHQVLLTEGLRKLELRRDGEIVKEYTTISKKPEIKKMGVTLIGGGLLTWCDRSAFTTPIDTKGATIAAAVLGIIAVLTFFILLHTCHKVRRLKKKGKLDMVKHSNNSSQPLQLDNEENHRPTILSNYKQVSDYNDRSLQNNHHSFEDDTEEQRYSFTSQSADQDFSLTSPSTDHYSSAGYNYDGDIKQYAVRGQP
ncbi:unnamed protein product, partial [Meganyctiphanes norvegica]